MTLHAKCTLNNKVKLFSRLVLDLRDIIAGCHDMVCDCRGICRWDVVRVLIAIYSMRVRSTHEEENMRPVLC